LASGEYVGWLAYLNAPPHAAIGGAGVQLRPLLPRPDPTGQFLLRGLDGLVLNVYVDEAHRRLGVARRLMATRTDWAPGAGIVRLVLHASPDGRPLYESLGFLATNEMLFPPFGTDVVQRFDSLEIYLWLEPSLELLLTERRDRVDPNRPPRRNRARHQRDGGQQGDRPGKGR
jgi:GNAT superfamily N-acetyltransferase